jgi:hypothetical protein
VSDNEFKKVMIVILGIFASPRNLAAGVVAEESCLLMRLPFLLLSANGSM